MRASVDVHIGPTTTILTTIAGARPSTSIGRSQRSNYGRRIYETMFFFLGGTTSGLKVSYICLGGATPLCASLCLAVADLAIALLWYSDRRTVKL